MSESFTPVANTDQPAVWFNLTNSMASCLTNRVVTANTGGAMTVGVGFVSGSFGANTLVSTNLSGGNTTVNSGLTVTSNCQFNQGMTIFNIIHNNVNTSTTGTSSQVVDSFLLNTYRSAEYNLTIKNAVANGYQVSKILVLQDGGTGYITEFGVLSSNGSQGVFSVSTNSTAAILSFTPVSTSTTIQGSKIETSV